MKQKAGSIWERGGCVGTSGMKHPLPGKFLFHARHDFKTVLRASGFLSSPPIKIKN